MGAFFTNVQVFRKPGVTLEQLSAALVRHARRAGLTLVEDEAEGADREIVVVPGGRWFSVFDEATESQDLDALDALTAALSRKAPAFSVTVHDSDILELRLFRRGKLVDRHGVAIGALMEREPTEEEVAEARGNPRRWARLLVDGHSAGELAAVWDEQPDFVEDTLCKLAPLMGCRPELLSTGFNYLGEQELPDRKLVLRFRRPERPWWLMPTEGPPAFGGIRPVAQLRCPVGNQLHLATLCCNSGGPSSGLSIVCYGDALTKQLIELGPFVVGSCTRRREPKIRQIEPTVGNRDGEAALSALVEDRRIPGGIVLNTAAVDWSAADPRFDDLGEQMVAHRARDETTLRVHINGRYVRPGSGKLTLEVSPLANATNGVGGQRWELIIE